MATYRDLEFIGETYVEFYNEHGKWYLTVYDPDCPEGFAPDLELSEKYTEEDIKRIQEKYMPNADIDYY